MMNLRFNLVDFPEPITKGWDYPLLWDVEFDPGVGVAELREALAQESWRPMNLGYGLENNAKRHLLAAPYRSPALGRIDQSFRNPVFKHLLLDTLSSVPYFHNLWPTDKLAEITEISTLWGRDSPGYVISPHLDNRLQICTGMIFFNETDDPASGTQFTRTQNGPVIKTGRSGFGQGWLLVHDYHGWHHGGNGSGSDRFHLTFHLRIKI